MQIRAKHGTGWRERDADCLEENSNRKTIFQHKLVAQFSITAFHVQKGAEAVAQEQAMSHEQLVLGGLKTQCMSTLVLYPLGHPASYIFGVREKIPKISTSIPRFGKELFY